MNRQNHTIPTPDPYQVLNKLHQQGGQIVIRDLTTTLTVEPATPLIAVTAKQIEQLETTTITHEQPIQQSITMTEVTEEDRPSTSGTQIMSIQNENRQNMIQPYEHDEQNTRGRGRGRGRGGRV